MASKYLYLNSRDELFRMDVAKIVYFEADGNYTNFVMSDKVKGAVCMNLGEMQKQLTECLQEAAQTFARIGKRHIVNLTYVYHISLARQRLVLSDGEVFAYPLSISKEALKALKEMLVQSINNTQTTQKQDIKA
ncbi:MAG: LytTR family transcriptional regulator DNA-binding domain-containing protein [Bacteroidaceae bacterium]|nr:LytTR family transcriptional regulator DNA-binding domain-containing protein [Bacteroidaceae bacterium]